MEAVYRFEATLTESVPVGLVPEGVRIDLHFEGEVVEGALTGARVRGIDYLLFRADGVGVINAYEVISTDDGDHISLHARGYAVLPEGLELPPPDVLLSPDFSWPDVDIPLHGFVMASSGSQAHAWLNSTALAFEGTANMGVGKLVVAGRSLVPLPVS